MGGGLLNMCLLNMYITNNNVIKVGGRNMAGHTLVSRKAAISYQLGRRIPPLLIRPQEKLSQGW